MQLTNIQLLQGKIRLLTGLHIGAGSEEMHIGGTDNPVIKNPLTGQPYIPGSSLKGKMRSLLEWQLGVVGLTEGKPLSFKHISKTPNQAAAKQLLKLFGGSPDPSNDDKLITEIGPTRLAFWDCSLNQDWVKREVSDKNRLFTETKMENMIDRIQGVAQHPRNTERVPAGAEFDFKLTLRVHDGEDLSDMLFQGLKLIELTGLGGSLSRGYGKIEFVDLKLGNTDVQAKLDAVTFGEAA
ncbi:MAG: type III-A CRISPR-associated RAMP protein Csm3 [Candidatus Thiothrix putei]|uniref:CRISPR system Cms endoribonuclease Csm3 n=1 Tax=Candidatus Thiothrix putei TaxID=3080811 RepID=A0AA95KJI3_9GAMM|nr:MAG: type III-A CRISPR-associated RAMP protein Csm3 [Candidatus Thiothrix putei]